MHNFIGYYESPVGWLCIRSDEEAVTEVSFCDAWKPEARNQIIDRCIRELEEYFHGTRKSFQVPLKFDRGTKFQQDCWSALLQVPYGATCSYQDIGEAIGKKKAVRAVGGANHNNPICIIVPCHRVIGKNGSLVGYGGGIDKKRYLLELEAKYAKPDENHGRI